MFIILLANGYFQLAQSTVTMQSQHSKTHSRTLGSIGKRTEDWAQSGTYMTESELTPIILKQRNTTIRSWWT